MTESRISRLDRFDLLVAAVIIVLLALIGVVVARGDQVGITVGDGDYAPLGAVTGAEPVRVRFSDAMDRASVERRFRITPQVPGDFAWWGGQTLVFTPRQPLIAGQTYTVTIDAGAQGARHGSELLDPLTWSFSVRLPRVVYLGPADAPAVDLYMTDLNDGAITQLTQTPHGVEDYAISPGGGQIAYTRLNDDGTADIWLLDLLSGTQRPLTNCVRAECGAPAWRPDGQQIAYQRRDFGVPGSRVWLVDINTLQSDLFFADAEILGSTPTWSPDGRRLAVFDSALPGIRVHDFEMQTDAIIESDAGVVGAFSPDGERLIYPISVRGAIGDELYTHLQLVDFAASSRERLSGAPDAPVHDGLAVWAPPGSPHSGQVLIARRYLDERFTPGAQIYLLDLESGEVTPLVVDPAYHHAAMRWDAGGTRIVYQRFAVGQPGAEPEVLVYDLETGESTLITENAFLPRWLP